MVAKLRLTERGMEVASPFQRPARTAGDPALPILRPAKFMDEKPEPDWITIRAEYESDDDTIIAISERHNVPTSTIYSRASREMWPRRRAHTTRRSVLIGRMFALLEQQIQRLEIDMAKREHPEGSDKEVAVLGNLTRNLEKLIELDIKDKAGRPKPADKTEMEALRKKLATRIEQLKRGQ